MSPLQPDLFGLVHVEAQHLRPRQTVSCSRFTTFEIHQ